MKAFEDPFLQTVYMVQQSIHDAVQRFGLSGKALYPVLQILRLILRFYDPQSGRIRVDVRGARAGR